MRYALIGCGRISPNHIVAAKDNNLEMVAICDIIEKNMHDKIVKFHLPDSMHCYTDYNEMLKIESNICVENEEYMLNLGKKLMKNEIDNVQWIKKNIITDNIEEKADLVISSYVLNEIKAENRNQILEKLWNSTEKLLLIIEPGTPEGYNQIKEIRDYFIKKGANIVAPCAHEKECKISKNDWCAFSCRVARTKVHKLLKDGEAPYEDEKFSYIAVSKMKTDKKDRILRHPKIENGRITLKLCTTEGDIEEKTITKKEKEKFKIAKKLNNGDILK